MRTSFALISALAATAFAAPSKNQFDSFWRRDKTSKGFTVARPGDVSDIIITDENTLNGTYHGPHTTVVHKMQANAVPGNLALEMVNHFGSNVNAYIQGKDSDNKIVFVGAGGSLIYPSSGGSEVPVPVTEPIAVPMGDLDSTSTINLPIALISGRVYFCEGELQFFMVKAGDGDGLVQPSVNNIADPASGLNWGFVELTYTTDLALYANISYVDFVGMILSMQLTNTDGSQQLTKGLDAGAVNEICGELSNQQGADGLPWASMCIAGGNGSPIRVLAPADYSSIDPNSFANYWSDYVDQVWAKYTNEPLMINTQTDAGIVNCQVSGDTLNCAGDNRGFTKPSATDIWGCNGGPFGRLDGDSGIHIAVIPRLCAAFTRSTLLIEGGNTQPGPPATSYYQNSPTSHYSRILHQFEVDGRGYTFSYDDVNPDGNDNASGTVASGNPQTLTVWIGGY